MSTGNGLLGSFKLAVYLYNAPFKTPNSPTSRRFALLGNTSESWCIRTCEYGNRKRTPRYQSPKTKLTPRLPLVGRASRNYNISSYTRPLTLNNRTLLSLSTRLCQSTAVTELTNIFFEHGKYTAPPDTVRLGLRCPRVGLTPDSKRTGCITRVGGGLNGYVGVS